MSGRRWLGLLAVVFLVGIVVVVSGRMWAAVVLSSPLLLMLAVVFVVVVAAFGWGRLDAWRHHGYRHR